MNNRSNNRREISSCEPAFQVSGERCFAKQFAINQMRNINISKFAIDNDLPL